MAEKKKNMQEKAGKDYEKLGFRCGLELHQQIEGKKLFCDCPTSNLRDTKPDVKFKRRLRAVAGETGKVDVAAKYEMERSRQFIYEADSKDVCLVDMDEEPPHPINPEAVDATLQAALLLDAKVVDEIQVMRKTVIDGSNVSGFQRTALVAYDGHVDTSKGKVKISSICLEEEAAQKIKEEKGSVAYRLDRLGIPLIEIATYPDIKDPEHAKETAEKIGMILRSTGKMKRGLGTIRQDVNISIKGKNRVEIKGFQDIRSMPNVIEKEVERQISLEEKEDAHVRKVEPGNSTAYLRPMPGAARMYPETDILPFQADISKIEIPELIEDKIKTYEKLGLAPELAKAVAASKRSDLFLKCVKEFTNIKPAFIAETLTSTLKEIRRKYEADVENITDKQFLEVFSALDQEKIPKDTVINILIDYASGKFESMEKYKVGEIENLEEEIEKIVENIKQKVGETEFVRLNLGAFMGEIMKKFKGKVDGKKAMKILNKIMNKNKHR